MTTYPPQFSQLTPALILNAYAVGLFPMAESKETKEIFWVDPNERGIIPLDGFHISKSLKKIVRKKKYRVTFNQNFGDVIRFCAEYYKSRRETWINQTIIDLYTSLHLMRHAHSIEVYHENILVGGLYGVTLGGVFFGESMFSREANTSKIALVYLVARLRRQKFKILDTQFITNHLKQFGAITIPRHDYLLQLKDALEDDCEFDDLVEEPDISINNLLEI